MEMRQGGEECSGPGVAIRRCRTGHNLNPEIIDLRCARRADCATRATTSMTHTPPRDARPAAVGDSALATNETCSDGVGDSKTSSGNLSRPDSWGYRPATGDAGSSVPAEQPEGVHYDLTRTLVARSVHEKTLLVRPVALLGQSGRSTPMSSPVAVGRLRRDRSLAGVPDARRIPCTVPLGPRSPLT